MNLIDKYTFEITLKEKYPQFLYWLSMSFFAPMPWEADFFYSQKGFEEKNILVAYDEISNLFKSELPNYKYEIVFTIEAKKKLEKEVNLQDLKIIKKIKNRDEIENLLGEKSNHQGICLKAKKIANQELKELISNIKSDKSLIVLLDQLEDPQNVGAIFRSALAFNLNGVIMTENNSVNENAFLTKAASGGIDKLAFTKIKKSIYYQQ